MKITYSKEADVAYIYLEEKEDSKVKKTIPLLDTSVNKEIYFDFDEKDKLVGIEFLQASKTLPKELLDKAEITN